MKTKPGRHFLHIPGPTNIPDRILRAMDYPAIDQRGPQFAELAKGLLDDMRRIFKTETGRIVIYPSSGTGAWEAAMTNTLNPGDTVLMAETGMFATLWKTLADRNGIGVQWIEGDWRSGVDPEAVEAALRADTDGRIKAVCAVHNETSTSCTSRIAEVRAAIDAAGHDALFFVDTISSLASIDFRMDAWKVDVAIGGSQKGLMLPAGLGFNAISEKAVAAAKSAGLKNGYWNWDDMFALNRDGAFPYTPAANLMYALREAIDMLEEEGLDNVFARHARFGAATRKAAQAWGLELQCANQAEYSDTLTAIRLPDGHDADRFRALVLDAFDLSLGNGLGPLKGKVFRVGHLGSLNDLMLMGALSGVEMGLGLAGVPHEKGGAQAAMDHLRGSAQVQ